MKKIIFIAFLSIFQAMVSQDKGTISGTLTDKEMGGDVLPFANVSVKGTTIGVASDMDGKYSLQVPVGNQTIVFSFVGYQTIEKTVLVKAGQTTTLNVEMGASEGVSLDEIEIKGTVSKEKETALLVEQKKATIIKESIGAQELSKKGVSDAASATTKISGVAKQEGSNKIYVRGLGDRYNSTSLNGLPLPSNDPRFKNISLELFSTDIIQNVGISKTFSSNLNGDVAGANIDVVSKEFSGKPRINVGVSTGINTVTTGKDFKKIDGANWFGIANNTKHPVTSLNQLPFTDSFTPNTTKADPELSVSISGGRRFNFGEESDSSLSMFLVGSFDNKYSFRDGTSINYLREDGSKGTNYFSAKDYSYSTSKLLMGNFIYRINENNKVSFNSLFIHSNSQTIQDYYGKKPNVADDDGEFANIVLQTENQNRLFVNQILSKHKVSENFDLNLSLAYNKVKNDEPNRKKNLFRIDENKNTTTFASGASRNNSRYFHNLNEDDFVAKVDAVNFFGSREDNKIKLDFGYLFRSTDRAFNQFYFDYDIASAQTEVDLNNIDAVLNQDGIDNNIFRILTHFGFSSDALEPLFYKGSKMVNAFYTTLNYQLSEKLFLNGGVRFENLQMDVNWRTAQQKQGGQIELNKNYFLPSLNLKYNFTNDNLLRLAASQTYTFPQFKEIAPFPYEGLEFIEMGNENLKPSTNYNIDLKWEMYPKSGELFSASVFTKIIKNAISRVELSAASENFYSYDNTGDANVYGMEVEARKNLIKLSTDDDDFEQDIKLGINATYMYSKQTLTPTAQFNPTKTKEKLEGAAPFIINADITYRLKADEKETVASLIFNYQDEKVFAVGANFLDAIYQKPLPKLDFVFKHQFNKDLGIKFNAKNLINPKIQRYRDVPSQLIMKDFKRGIDFSLGFTYKI